MKIHYLIALLTFLNPVLLCAGNNGGGSSIASISSVTESLYLQNEVDQLVVFTSTDLVSTTLGVYKIILVPEYVLIEILNSSGTLLSLEEYGLSGEWSLVELSTTEHNL